LTLITLGVYYFWGKVRVRRYLFSQTEFAGDRFAYYGAGEELLIGFLKAAVVFGLPLGLLHVVRNLPGVGAGVKAVAAVLMYGTFWVLLAVATVGGRRYRLSRTSWRGIRFSFRGRTGEFLKLSLQGLCLTAITLGLYYPFLVTRRYDFLTSHSYFGSQQFHFDGRGRDVLGIYCAQFMTLLLSVLLVVFVATPLLPVSWVVVGLPLLLLLTGGFWWCSFSAAKQRYFWAHTSLSTARFHSTVAGRRLFSLYLGNLLLLLFTLGLGWPWGVARKVRYVFANLTLEGALDPSTIRQEAQSASATGEELADFLSLDVDLG